MTVTATTALNHTKVRQARPYDDSCPFPLITKRQFLEELAESHRQILNGDFITLDALQAEVKQKYGF